MNRLLLTNPPIDKEILNLSIVRRIGSLDLRAFKPLITMEILEMKPAGRLAEQTVADVYIAKFDLGIIGIKIYSENKIDYRSTVTGTTDDDSANASTIKVRPGLFIISWQSVNTTTYALVLDLKNEKAFCNVTMPDKRVINLAGVV